MPPAPEPDDEVLERTLEAALYQVDCPPPHAIGEYELDVLETRERVQVAQHLAECDACRAELADLRGFLALDIAAPDALLGRARRLIAVLLTPRAGLAYGLRGARHAGNLVYAVQGITLSLSVGHGALTGLLVADAYTAEQLEGRAVRLVNGPEVGIDDLSGFEFSDVPSGVYTLEVDLPDSTLVVEALQL